MREFLDELRERFQRVDMVYDPINLVVTLEPELVLGMLERVPQTVPTPNEDDFGIEPLRLSLGRGLSRVIKELPEWYPELQRHSRLKLGLELPSLFLWCDPGLPAMAWTIDLHEEVTARGQAGSDLLLARGSEEALRALQSSAVERSELGLWIRPEQEPKAIELGCEVVDLIIVAILVQLNQVLLRRSGDLLSLEQVKRMVERVRRTDPLVVEELVPARLSWSALHEVLQNLLSELVPIRDVRRILEVLLRNLRHGNRVDTLTEYARRELSRSICRRLTRQGRLSVLALHPDLESRVFESSQVTDQGRFPLPNLPLYEHLVQRLGDCLPLLRSADSPQVLMTSPHVRALVRSITERSLPALAVLSWNEVPPGVKVSELGVVGP